MIQSETLELVKVLSNPDTSGAILLLEIDAQNIQVEKVDKYLSINTIEGKVYKVSLSGQKELYNLTNKIAIECAPRSEGADYTNSAFFSYQQENDISCKFIFNIKEFYDSIKNAEIQSSLNEPLGYALQNVTGEQFLKIIIYNEDKTIPMLIYNIPILLRVPQGLLDFNINAQDITAAIDNTGMKFNINGLKIINGGFSVVKSIQGQEDEEVLSFNNGQLKIEGSGSFTGEITANKGAIANFTIEQNSLSTEDLVLQSSYIDAQGVKVPSKIQVKNIDIGRGAYIEEYIQLGNGYIHNPNLSSNSSRLFIETLNDQSQSTFSLTDGGVIKLGPLEDSRIVLNGTDSTIRGKNWLISPEFASFSNVEVSGVINTAVFNQSSIQNVGSTMIFQDSAKIDSNFVNDEGYFQVENNALTINVGDLVQLSNLDNGSPIIARVIRISQNRHYVELVDASGSEDRLNEMLNSPDTIITVLGVSGDTIFSISASNKFNSKPYLHSNALSLAEILEEEGQVSYQKKLVLGNLSGIQYAETSLSGYGLYCENVYLNGQLVGRAGQPGNYYYAGISTINNIKSSYFNNEDIIFWAGAKSLNPTPNSDDIPFYITTNGNLYASSGVFKGSLITDATITASSLKAAAIYPLDTESASLKIFNTNREKGGISFREDDGNEGVETLNLSSSGFTANGKTFVDLSQEDRVDISASTFTGKIVNLGNKIFVNDQGLNFLDSNDEILDLKNFNYGLFFTNAGFELKDRTGGNFNYNKNKGCFEVQNADFKLGQSVFYSEKMRYQKVIIEEEEVGYDLYIDD